MNNTNFLNKELKQLICPGYYKCIYYVTYLLTPVTTREGA